MYKVTFGRVDANRGIEYASRVNKSVIRGLWGHNGTKVTDLGYDDNGNELYQLTDNDITFNPLLVTCEYVAEVAK